MGANSKLKLEEYEYFLENDHCHQHLTNEKLNQIIQMHGFSKLRGLPKKELLEALSSIDLLVPRRTTLKEDISPHASLSTEEVKEDIEALQWQECPVQSIGIIEFMQEHHDSDNHCRPRSNGSCDLSFTARVRERKHAGKRRRRSK